MPTKPKKPEPAKKPNPILERRRYLDEQIDGPPPKKLPKKTK